MLYIVGSVICLVLLGGRDVRLLQPLVAKWGEKKLTIHTGTTGIQELQSWKKGTMGTFHIKLILQGRSIQNLTISHLEPGGFVKSFFFFNLGRASGAARAFRRTHTAWEKLLS